MMRDALFSDGGECLLIFCTINTVLIRIAHDHMYCIVALQGPRTWSREDLTIMSLTAFNAIFAPHHQHVQHARQSMEGAVHATLFIDSLAVGLIVPLLPFRGDEMRLSAVTFGLVTSLYGISQIIGGVIIGILADRVFGRKLALISSLLISSFGYLLLMSSNSVQSFALSRTLVGFFRHSTSLSQAMVSQTSVSPSALARLGYRSYSFLRVPCCVAY